MIIIFTSKNSGKRILVFQALEVKNHDLVDTLFCKILQIPAMQDFDFYLFGNGSKIEN